MQQNLHLTALAEMVSMHSGHLVGGKKYADSLDTANPAPVKTSQT